MKYCEKVHCYCVNYFLLNKVFLSCLSVNFPPKSNHFQDNLAKLAHYLTRSIVKNFRHSSAMHIYACFFQQSFFQINEFELNSSGRAEYDYSPPPSQFTFQLLPCLSRYTFGFWCNCIALMNVGTITLLNQPLINKCRPDQMNAFNATTSW